MDSTDEQSRVETSDGEELRIVSVNWLDAVANASWHEPEAEPANCITVGFLVAETDLAIEVASTLGMGDEGVVNASMVIPKSMVVEINDVGEQRSIH